MVRLETGVERALKSATNRALSNPTVIMKEYHTFRDHHIRRLKRAGTPLEKIAGFIGYDTETWEVWEEQEFDRAYRTATGQLSKPASDGSRRWTVEQAEEHRAG